MAGPPASGKSTFCPELARHINNEGLGFTARYFPENVHKPLLNAYLESEESRHRYAFSFQFIMAQRRISTYREALSFAETGGVTIVDGPLQTDIAFALLNHKKGYIDQKDYGIYLSMLKEYDGLKKPDYLLYLNVTPETAHRRLVHRVEASGVKGEVVAYDATFYHELHEMNRVAFSNLQVSVINYDTDDTSGTTKHQEPRTLSKQYLYSILTMVLTGDLLQTGL